MVFIKCVDAQYMYFEVFFPYASHLTVWKLHEHNQWFDYIYLNPYPAWIKLWLYGKRKTQILISEVFPL